MTMTERWQWLAVALVGGVMIYLLAPALTPFAIAALFAYLWDPVVDRLERLGLSRNFSVSLVFLFIVVAVVAIILLVIPFTERQIAKFLDQLPRWLAWIQAEAQPQRGEVASLVHRAGLARAPCELERQLRAQVSLRHDRPFSSAAASAASHTLKACRNERTR